jgi:hypothetical protein
VNTFRPVSTPTVLLFVALLVVLAAACGQDGAVPPTPVPQNQQAEASVSPTPGAVLDDETPSPVAVPDVPEFDTTATQVPTEPPQEPADTPTPILTDGESEAVEETQTSVERDPTATPTPAPTSTPIPPPTQTPTLEPTPLGDHTVIDSYAFALTVDGDVNASASGWLESEPDRTQGQIAFAFSGATVLLIWLPAGSSAPAQLVAAGFDILGDSQPALTFEAVSEGAIGVDGDEGAFGGFAVVDQSGNTLGGGLIGGWLCDGTGFILSVTGSDSTVVQVRFDRVLYGFECAGR